MSLSAGSNLNNRSIPGRAMRVQRMKKVGHPVDWAIMPVVDEMITRGTPIRLESRAYWVAVNRLSVTLAMKAR